MSQLINVHIGEVKTGSGNQVLQALLGSCVGVALLWKKQNIFGLAHCLLANTPNSKSIHGGKYVDQAIHSLVNMMSITPDKRFDVSAVIIGGGNMTKPPETENEKLVGFLNTQCAIETLEELKINILHQETGGTYGRKIRVDCNTGLYAVDIIPRPEVA